MKMDNYLGIKGFGGITHYLNETARVGEHNGVHAQIIIGYWNWGKKPHMSVSALAIMCGVSRQTMEKYLDMLHEEYEKPRPRSARAGVKIHRRK